MQIMDETFTREKRKFKRLKTKGYQNRKVFINFTNEKLISRSPTTVPTFFSGKFFFYEAQDNFFTSLYS